MLDRFFHISHERNQFYCRALFVQAQLHSLPANSSIAIKRFEHVSSALSFIMEALQIAMQSEYQPSYQFLVYNASVHFWRICRLVFRIGTARHLVTDFERVVQALEQTNDIDKVWRIHLQMYLALAFDDAKQRDKSIQWAQSAFAATKQLEETFLDKSNNPFFFFSFLFCKLIIVVNVIFFIII